jgi:hypothetical protein
MRDVITIIVLALLLTFCGLSCRFSVFVALNLISGRVEGSTKNFRFVRQTLICAPHDNNTTSTNPRLLPLQVDKIHNHNPLGFRHIFPLSRPLHLHRQTPRHKLSLHNLSFLRWRPLRNMGSRPRRPPHNLRPSNEYRNISIVRICHEEVLSSLWDKSIFAGGWVGAGRGGQGGFSRNV